MNTLGSSHVSQPYHTTSFFLGLGYTNRVYLRGCRCVTSQQREQKQKTKNKKSWHRTDLAAAIETVTEASQAQPVVCHTMDSSEYMVTYTLSVFFFTLVASETTGGGVASTMTKDEYESMP